MVDLISRSFVKSLGLSPYTSLKYQYEVPIIKGVGQTSPKTYSFFHLKVEITNRYNYTFSFVRPFLAIDRSHLDSQVLLGRLALKDFRIILYNSNALFEFKRNPKVTKITPYRFAYEFARHASYF